MSEELNTLGAEVQEPAEPVYVQEGAEVQEPAEPVVTNNNSDAAFADMRRGKEAAEKALNDANAQNQKLLDALGLYFDGSTADDKIAQAIATAQSRDVADVKRELAEKSEVEKIRNENNVLKNELMDRRVKDAMAQDLAEIQKIDPNIKDLNELGTTFANLIKGGCDAVTAYYGAKAESERNKVSTPKPPGKLNSETPAKGYFTRDEVKNMSAAEIRKHYDIIRASQTKW